MYRHASERLKPRHLSRRGFGEFGTAVTTTDLISNGMAMRVRLIRRSIRVQLLCLLELDVPREC